MITSKKNLVYCSFFICNFFIDSVGKVDIHNNPTVIILNIHKYEFLNKSISNALYNIIGNSANTAPAGAGTPVKKYPDNGVFIFSMSWVLKRANRNPMHIAKNIDAIHPIRFKFDKLYKYNVIAGPNPNAAKSAMESNSAPNLLHEFNNLANLPSDASNIADTKTVITANSHLPTKANFI